MRKFATKTSSDYVWNSSHAIGLVLLALDTAPDGAVSLVQLAKDRVSLNHCDMGRIRKNEGASYEEAPYVWLRLGAYKVGKRYFDIEETEGDTIVRMKPGESPHNVKVKGKRVAVATDYSKFNNPFWKNRDTIYSRLQAARLKAAGIDDLVASMKADGWYPDSVVLKDATTGAIISGNRRMAAVEQLRQEGVIIHPKIETFKVEDEHGKLVEVQGEGDGVDRVRLRRWWNTNNTQLEWTAKQRKDFAKFLTLEEYDASAIAEIMGISERLARLYTEDARAEIKEDIRQEIIRLSEMRDGDGEPLHSQREIAKMVRVTQPTVYRVIQNGKACQNVSPASGEADIKIPKVPDPTTSDRGKVYASVPDEGATSDNLNGDQLRELAKAGFLYTNEGETRNGKKVYRKTPEGELEAKLREKANKPKAIKVKATPQDFANAIRKKLSGAEIEILIEMLKQHT